MPAQCLQETPLSLIEFSDDSQCLIFETKSLMNTKIENIVIPSKTTEIQNEAFSGCDLLQTITFASNESLTSIGENAFNGCNALLCIDIPFSCKTIGTKAFYKC